MKQLVFRIHSIAQLIIIYINFLVNVIIVSLVSVSFIIKAMQQIINFDNYLYCDLALKFLF